MSKYKSSRDKYPSCNIKLEINKFIDSTEEDFEEIKTRIELSGGKIVRVGNIIDIFFDRDDFVNAHNRKCGQKEKTIIDINEENVTFADLVYWHTGLKESWTEIAGRLNISRATLFRRKKKYEQYSYFNHYMSSYDISRADDLEYLRSLPDGESLFI